MMARIHCYSCGKDTVTSAVEQPHEKPIRRCANCRSLFFKVLEEDQPLPAPKVEITQMEDESLQEA